MQDDTLMCEIYSRQKKTNFPDLFFFKLGYRSFHYTLVYMHACNQVVSIKLCSVLLLPSLRA